MILKKKDGFTLIEVLVAIAIIAIVGVILSSTVSTTLKARTISQERLNLLALCTSNMDEIKSNQVSFANLSDIDAWLQGNGYTKQSGYYQKDDSETGIEIDVYLNPNLNINGLFEIKLVGKSMKTSELTLSTVIKGGH